MDEREVKLSTGELAALERVAASEARAQGRGGRLSAPADSLPTQPASASSDASDSASRRPRSFWARHRRAIGGTIGAVVAAGFVYYVLPRLAGLGPTLRLLRRGDVSWLALGVVLEALSFVGMILLFRGVFGATRNRINWRASYQITVAGAAATKVVAAAGAGGIALTVWALRAYGLSGAEVATGMVKVEGNDQLAQPARDPRTGLGLRPAAGRRSTAPGSRSLAARRYQSPNSRDDGSPRSRSC